MPRNRVKTVSGWIIIVGHFLTAFLIVVYLDGYLNLGMKLQVLLTMMPLTAAYFTSVVRNFIADQRDLSPGPQDNGNFAIIAMIVPLVLIAFIDYLILRYPSDLAGDVPSLQTWTAAIEVVIGGALGSLVADLFPTQTTNGTVPPVTPKEEQH